MLFVYVFNAQIRNIIIAVTKWLDFYYGYFYNLYDKRQGSGALLVINIFAFIVIFKCFESRQKKGLYLEKKFNFYYNTQFLCLFFCILMSILPNGERIMTILTIGIYSVFFVELFVIKNIGATFPYKFIFSK